MVLFARRVAHFTEVADVAHPDEDTRVYGVKGELFFASSNDLVYQFDYGTTRPNVIIDLSDSQIYDSSTVAALDAIELKYRRTASTPDCRTERGQPGLARPAVWAAGIR